MGLNPLNNSLGNQSPGNPNPQKFTILMSEGIHKLFVALLQYDGCTNYEGKKVVVLDRDPSILDYLDPHFEDDKPYTIYARFRPTVEGWDDAVAYATSKGEKL